MDRKPGGFSELPTSLLAEKKPGFGDQVFWALIPKLRLADMAANSGTFYI